MPTIPSARRFWFSAAVVSVLFMLLLYQVVQLTVIHRDALRNVADNQHLLKVEIPPVRGQILDRYGKELATSLKVPSIYAVPRMMGSERKAKLAVEVSKILGLDESFVLKRFSRDKAFIWLKRRVDFETAEKIRNLKDPALGILNEYKRFYPQGELLSQILGFTDIDGEGLEGVELVHDKALKGTPGLRYTKRDALGREIKAFEIKAVPAIDGNKVHLTIDHYLQYLTERALDEAYQKWKAEGASAIIMEVNTGKIVALANRPHFDPNFFSQSKPENRRNRAVTDMYEPGSVFKIVAAAAALNEETVKLDTIFDCENGEYRYGSRILHDAHPYGDLTFEEVIVKSSNIGTVKIAATMKPETYYDYIKRFGFASPTGIDMPGEANGFIRHPRQWSSTSPYNIPMGHEVLVTLTQMVRAMAAIANGGKLVKPFIVEKIEDQKGVTLQETKPVIEDGVIRPEVAAQMRKILTKVVDEGTGRRAQIKGIPVAGKTGTAQKVLPNGRGYSKDDFMSSFVGFAPADKPKYVMAVLLDDPGPRYYGGTVAAPVFKTVMEAAVRASGYIPEDVEIFDPTSSRNDLQDKRPIALPAGGAGRVL